MILPAMERQMLTIAKRGIFDRTAGSKGISNRFCPEASL
jgi:hypothetical protein